MKYRYIPNCHIIDYENNRTKFIFDENGEFETDDPKLIDWIRKNKNFLKPVEEPAAAGASADAKDSPFLRAYYAYVNEGKKPGDAPDPEGATPPMTDAGTGKTDAGTEGKAAAAGIPDTPKPEEPKTYKCRATGCGFVGRSIQEMGAHSRTAHPKPKTRKEVNNHDYVQGQG